MFIQQRLDYISQLPYWIFLYQSGVGHKSIANKCGAPPSAVYSYLRRFEFINPDNVSLMKIGEKNPMWKGDKVQYVALHNWVIRHKRKISHCEICKIKPPLDLANISPKYDKSTYNRDLDNWRWLCRKCHMVKDGRINNLRRYATK